MGRQGVRRRVCATFRKREALARLAKWLRAWRPTSRAVPLLSTDGKHPELSYMDHGSEVVQAMEEGPITVSFIGAAFLLSRRDVALWRARADLKRALSSQNPQVQH